MGEIEYKLVLFISIMKNKSAKLSKFLAFMFLIEITLAKQKHVDNCKVFS